MISSDSSETGGFFSGAGVSTAAIFPGTDFSAFSVFSAVFSTVFGGIFSVAAAEAAVAGAGALDEGAGGATDGGADAVCIVLGRLVNRSLIIASLVCAAALPLSSCNALPYAWLAILA